MKTLCLICLIYIEFKAYLMRDPKYLVTDI